MSINSSFDPFFGATPPKEFSREIKIPLAIIEKPVTEKQRARALAIIAANKRAIAEGRIPTGDLP